MTAREQWVLFRHAVVSLAAGAWIVAMDRMLPSGAGQLAAVFLGCLAIGFACGGIGREAGA